VDLGKDCPGELFANPEAGSSHINAKILWQSGWRGMVKKTSLRSRMEKSEVTEGIWENSVYGLDITGWVGSTAELTTLWSWTSLYEPSGFRTGRMGVLHGEWMGLRIFLARSLSMRGFSPHLCFREIRYWGLFGWDLESFRYILIGEWWKATEGKRYPRLLGLLYQEAEGESLELRREGN
jgi:hypothetical protein